MTEKTSRTSTSSDSFTADERAAMRERAAELRAQAKRAKGAAKAEAELNDLLEAIAKLPDEGDRALATTLHEVIMAAAAHLDDGAMWPASFAVTSLGAAEKKRITELVQRAIG